MRNLTRALVISLLVCGAAATFLGFVGKIYPLTSLVLIAPILILTLITLHVAKQRLKLHEWALLLMLCVVWTLHFTGVFVPETGFDAVWYHLPIVATFAAQHSIVYLPGMYQSVNPLFADMVFLLGYQVGGALGAKLIAFLFAVALILVSYQLARLFLSRSWSLLSVLIISTFQVVTWQSSSFYVDIAKAVWEVSALWLVLDQRDIVLSGLFFGASLGTKLFSVLLWPVFLFQRPWKKATVFFCVSLVIALPFYVWAYRTTGNPFYSIGIHEAKIAEIGGASTMPVYLIQRALSLPSSLTQLTLFSRDYTTLLFLVFFAPFVLQIKIFWKNLNTRTLLLFSVAQWLVWWFVPPLSTRYALSGFITLLILYIITIKQLQQPKIIVITILLSLLFNLLPRMPAVERNSIYLTHQQSTRQYVEQFYDGNIDLHLKQWYHLP